MQKGKHMNRGKIPKRHFLSGEQVPWTRCDIFLYINSPMKNQEKYKTKIPPKIHNPKI